jgi:ribonucleoside-diphosphate reductase alpha chain
MSYATIGKDISCNLASKNVMEVMRNGKHFGKTVEVAIYGLTAVSELSNLDCVPSIDAGNKQGHAVGLGDMNLHGFLGHEHIQYDSPEAREFADFYFAATKYYAIKASSKIAKERGKSFATFCESDYYNGKVFTPYIQRDWSIVSPRIKNLFEKYNFYIPTSTDWLNLSETVHDDGMYNQNLMAIAPTGSISYSNHSTASIAPIADRVESRTEGSMGRVYYPASMMTNENTEYFKTAYEYGWKSLIDMYAVIAKHVDQSSSMTLFMPANATTRDLDRARMYAWSKGIKTTYYIRIYKGDAIESSRQNIQICEACSV